MAHVLVEPSRPFSRKLQELMSSRNPYGGFVGLIFPGGDVRRIDPSSFDSDRALEGFLQNTLRNALCERRALPHCTWSYIEALVARSVIEKLKSAESGDVEDYVEAFDSEIRAKDQQLEIAEDEIARLKTALSEAHSNISKRSTLQIEFGSEQELSAHEFDEIISDVLRNAIQSVPEGSPRHDVISAALSSIVEVSTLAGRRSYTKKILKGYRAMSSRTKEALKGLGIAVEFGVSHYKLLYGGDERYVVSLPASGSDHRGGAKRCSRNFSKVFLAGQVFILRINTDRSVRWRRSTFLAPSRLARAASCNTCIPRRRNIEIATVAIVVVASLVRVRR